MSESLQVLLGELEQFGQTNDAAIADRPRRMLNITRETGEFLSVLVQATNAQRILEIGYIKRIFRLVAGSGGAKDWWARYPEEFDDDCLCCCSNSRNPIRSRD